MMNVKLINGKIITIIDLVKMEKLLSKRFNELKPKIIQKVTSIYRKYNVPMTIKIKDNKYIIKAKTLTAKYYGNIKREILELNRNLTIRFKPNIRHQITILISKKPIKTFKIAVYELEGLSIQKYRVTSIASRIIHNNFKLKCDRYTANTIAIPLIGTEKLPQQLKINLENKELNFNFKYVKEISLNNKVDRDYVKRIINRSIKNKLRLSGHRIYGLKAILDQNLIENEQIEVKCGIEFQTVILDNNHVAIAISPVHELNSKNNLWDEYNHDPNKIRNDYKLIGRRVKPTYTPKTRIIRRVKIESITHPLRELGGISLKEYYENIGVEVKDIDDNEPVIELVGRGLYYYDSPSKLKKIITIKDLKETNLLNQVKNLIQLPPAKWNQYLSRYTNLLSTLDLEFQQINFVNQFMEVEIP